MDFNEVAIFIRVVQKGSFIGAARVLDMPKSTVSTKVSNLEKRLGTSLLKRSTRKLQLTQDGEHFYQRATKGIEEILKAEGELRSENARPHGRLRITAPVDIGGEILTMLTCNFLKKYPEVDFEIVLIDRFVDFLEEKVDLAIRVGELKDSSLIAKKVGDVAFSVYASPKYLKVSGAPKVPADLNAHPCIVFSPVSSPGWKLKSSKKSVTVSLPNRIVVNDINLVRDFALLGEGIALIPSFLCESDVKSGKLVHILKDWRSDVSPIHFVYPAQTYVQPAVKMFIEMSAPIMQSRFRVTES
jgi:DNA-binding transcriptional LysR family regulator